MGNFSPNGDLNLAPPSRLERGDCPSVVTGRASWRQATCEWFRCVFAEWPPAQCGKVPSKDLEIIQEKTAEAGHWKVLQQRKQYSLLVSWSCFLARGIGVSSEALPLWLEKSCFLRTYKINLLGRLRVSWVVRIDCTGEHVGLPAATRMPLSRSVNAGARPVKTMKLIRIRSLECRRFIYIYTLHPPSFKNTFDISWNSRHDSSKYFVTCFVFIVSGSCFARAFPWHGHRPWFSTWIYSRLLTQAPTSSIFSSLCCWFASNLRQKRSKRTPMRCLSRDLSLQWDTQWTWRFGRVGWLFEDKCLPCF